MQLANTLTLCAFYCETDILLCLFIVTESNCNVGMSVFAEKKGRFYIEYVFILTHKNKSLKRDSLLTIYVYTYYSKLIACKHKVLRLPRPCVGIIDNVSDTADNVLLH